MSSVKIQVVQSHPLNKVLVDNKFAYYFSKPCLNEMKNLKRLVEILNIDNVEVTDKERV